MRIFHQMNPSAEFAIVSKKYCELIAATTDIEAAMFVSELRQALPLLYYRALLLPGIEPTDVELDLKIPHDDWKEVYSNISIHLSVNDLYWEIYEPLVYDPEPPVCTTISDDLADIWRDLAIGAERWGEATTIERQEIVWHWRFSFRHHWSSHLVNALRALNYLAEPHGFPEDTNAK